MEEKRKRKPLKPGVRDNDVRKKLEFEEEQKWNIQKMEKDELDTYAQKEPEPENVQAEPKTSSAMLDIRRKLEEERRKFEEERRKFELEHQENERKDEEEKRKKEEDARKKIDAERKRLEEERQRFEEDMKMFEEEERQKELEEERKRIEESKRKLEELRKKKAEERRKKGEERKRKEEVARKRLAEERKKLAEERKRMDEKRKKKEAERQRKLEVERKRLAEEKKRIEEEERKKKEKERKKKKAEANTSNKLEETRRKLAEEKKRFTEERLRREQGRKRREEERKKKLADERKRISQQKKKLEEMRDARRKLEVEKRKVQRKRLENASRRTLGVPGEEFLEEINELKDENKSLKEMNEKLILKLEAAKMKMKSQDRGTSTNVQQSFNVPVQPIEVHLENLSQRDEWEELGSGGFATVYRATYRNAPVAVKCVSGQRRIKKNILSEIEKYYMNDPYVIRSYGYCLSENRKSVYIILELMDENAVEYCENASLKEKLELMIKMCFAVDYLHTETKFKKRILHRDIKASNFLVSRKGMDLKISDFGLAKIKMHSTTYSSSVQASGTYLYYSPELLLQQPPLYSIWSDVYALGITFYELLFNVTPFTYSKTSLEYGDGLVGMIARLKSTDYFPEYLEEDEDNEIPFVPKEVYDEVLVKMWKREPTQRISLMSIVDTLKKRVEKLRILE